MYETKSKAELNTVITGAKRNNRFFYIGVAGQRAGSSSAEEAVRHRDRGGHHADQEVRHPPRKVYHTRLMNRDNVCSLEQKLINKHGGHRLCVNQRRGNDECIRANRGIVYIRIY